MIKITQLFTILTSFLLLQGCGKLATATLSTETTAVTIPKNAASPSHCLGIYNVPTKRKVVALTFDDGPDEVYTKKVLKILKKYRVKATFFMVGKNVSAYPRVVKQVYASGHVIANHTNQHRNLAWLEEEAMTAEIMAGNEAIFRVIGRKPTLFRPPYGACSAKLPQVVEQAGMKLIMWNATTDDYRDQQTTPDKIVTAILSLVTPGAIILLHDAGGNRQKTVTALSTIIKILKLLDYDFVTVPKLLKIAPYQ